MGFGPVVKKYIWEDKDKSKWISIDQNCFLWQKIIKTPKKYVKHWNPKTKIKDFQTNNHTNLDFKAHFQILGSLTNKSGLNFNK